MPRATAGPDTPDTALPAAFTEKIRNRYELPATRVVAVQELVPNDTVALQVPSATCPQPPPSTFCSTEYATTGAAPVDAAPAQLTVMAR